MLKGLLSKLKKRFASDNENFILLVFIITDLLILLGLLGGNAWITVFYFILVALIIWLKTSDLVTSFLLMTIFSFQFYVPNKYYVLEVFKPSDLIPGWGSYFLSYGVNLENIFLVITVILILRNIIVKKWNFKKVFNKPTFLIAISGFVFFLISSYSSINYSPYQTLSVTWLFQYMQMYLIAFAILSTFHNKKKYFGLIIPVILSSIILQSSISILQFVRQSSLGIPMESFRVSNIYFGAPDAVHSIFRIAGTFGHPNQLALLLTTMLVIIIPYAITKLKPLYIYSSLLAITAIILSQSRSGWISLTIVTIFAIFIYKKNISKLISFFGRKRIYIFTTLTLIATSIVFVPRIMASLNSFSTGAGVPLRINMMKEFWQGFIENPWIGYGVGTNEPTLLKLFPTGYVYSFPAPIHMAYAQLILEVGFVGFCAFIFSFIYLIRYVINIYLLRKYKNTDKEYVFTLIAGILTFGLFYLFQPHQGYVEFPYLGIILAYGMVFISMTQNSK